MSAQSPQSKEHTDAAHVKAKLTPETLEQLSRLRPEHQTHVLRYAAATAPGSIDAAVKSAIDRRLRLARLHENDARERHRIFVLALLLTALVGVAAVSLGWFLAEGGNGFWIQRAVYRVLGAMKVGVATDTETARLDEYAYYR